MRADNAKILDQIGKILRKPKLDVNEKLKRIKDLVETACASFDYSYNRLYMMSLVFEDKGNLKKALKYAVRALNQAKKYKDLKADLCSMRERINELKAKLK